MVALGGWGHLTLAAPAVVARVQIPTVDRLVLTSVVDNVYDAILVSKRFGEVDVQRLPLREVSPAAEHGLALHLDSFRGDERRQILRDFPLTSPSLFTNYGLLGIDPAQPDALLLSHGHFDHFGGFLDLASRTPAWADRGMTLYAGGEDTFCMRWNVLPDGSRVNGNQTRHRRRPGPWGQPRAGQDADRGGRPRAGFGPDPARHGLRTDPADVPHRSRPRGHRLRRHQPLSADRD